MSTPTAPSPLARRHRAGRAARGASTRPAKAIGKTVRDTVKPGTLKDAAQRDVARPRRCTRSSPTSCVGTLDERDDPRPGRRRPAARTGADKLVGVGIAAYGPTALTGVTDWADSEAGRRRRPADRPRPRGARTRPRSRSYALSYRARRRGAPRRGHAARPRRARAALAVGGYLGGAPAPTRRASGVDQTRFDPGPDGLDAGDRRHASSARASRASVVVGETPVMLVRHERPGARAARPLLAPRLLAGRHRQGRRRRHRVRLPRQPVQPRRRPGAARAGDDPPAGLRGARERRPHRDPPAVVARPPAAAARRRGGPRR